MSFKESDFTSLASRDIAAQLTQDVQQYANDPSCEVAWACKAAERASIHMNLLLGCNTVELSLNKQHAAIYECFREMFPEMNVENVAEADLKGENKMKWFTFCERFKDSVEEYNLGTILRMRADGAYSEENTIIVPKIIFLAIEAARNKEGVNERAKEHYKREHERINREGGNIC
ncbi:Protein PBDC1 [Toxocara canis]|uniref:Protein PBDC1 n=1 Tax=Toxocara canis TaxID=6265 RepID=A0A0B2VSU5_TOXCA|nr:Protein PBDC1 [Toxocara canis]